MQVTPIPAFEDNYIWAIHDGRYCALVDPGEADPVLEWLEQTRVEPLALLITHHHSDHVGGIGRISARFGGIVVYGPKTDHILGLTHPVREGDTINLGGLEFNLEVINVPGHTCDHIAYYGGGMLFCGDTLFSCGCGRLFEGTPEQMYSSLNRLASLPAETRVYCAHEYTQSNIRFAMTVDPGNRTLVARKMEVDRLQQSGLPTLPSTIGLERLTNPFLRCSNEHVIASVQAHAVRPLGNALSVFAALREWKNNF
jgi:hydroxyacylglutathione hydrolase